MKRIGAGRRLIAAAIDILPIYAVGLLFSNEIYSRLITRDNMRDEPVEPQYIWYCLIIGQIISFLCYHILCENLFGRSIGKFFMNFKVYNKDVSDGRIGIRKSLIRNLLKINPYSVYSLLSSSLPMHDRVTGVTAIASVNVYSVLSNWIKNFLIISCGIGALYVLFAYGFVLQHIINIFVLICIVISVVGFIIRIVSSRK